MNIIVSFIQKNGEKREKGKTYKSFDFSKPSERECDLSLRLQAIKPSKFVETRRKVALRSEAYAWAPVLRGFDKLREVRVLSYLFYS